MATLARTSTRTNAPGRAGTTPARPRGGPGRRAAVLGAAFVLPFMLIFVAFRLGPSILGVLLSFLTMSLGGDFSWVGTANFAALFQDPVFWTSLRVTLVYSLISVPLTIAVSLVMAQLSARSVRGIKVYRAALFLPVITSLVTTAVIWRWLYSTEGPLNFFLGLFGIGPIPWLGTDLTVLPSLAVVSTWAHFGYYMLILLAGLLNIPRDYYEAAELDGAGAWRRFVHVTLPGLKRPLFFVVILDIVSSFQVFDLIYVMTGGGPVRSSYSMVFMIYDQGFRFGDFGYASAVGVVLFAITLVISLIQRRIFRED